MILISKIDLAEALDCDLSRIRADIAKLNTRAPVFETSTKTAAGLDQWHNWLRTKCP